MSHPLRRPVLAVAATMLVALGACALPTDESAQVLSGPEIESAMNPTTTSTTQAPGATTTHELFFLDANDDLVGVQQETPAGESFAAVLSLLAPTDEPRALTTSVPDGFIVSDTELTDGGLLTIILPEESESLFALGGAESIQAFAQIVVTAVALPGVERVQFVLNDEPRAVTMANGNSEDEPVDACDYVDSLQIPCTSVGQSVGPTTTTMSVPGS